MWDRRGVTERARSGKCERRNADSGLGPLNGTFVLIGGQRCAQKRRREPEDRDRDQLPEPGGLFQRPGADCGMQQSEDIAERARNRGRWLVEELSDRWSRIFFRGLAGGR